MELQPLQRERVSLSSAQETGRESKTLPRVLYVVNLNPTDKFGSFEEQIVVLNRVFQEEGSRFTPLFTVAPQPGRTDVLRGRGVEAHCLDMQRFRLSTLFALRDLIRAQEIELIHWHFTEPVCNPYVWSLSVLCPRVRHFFTDHISRPSEPYRTPTAWKKLLKRFLLKRYSHTGCVSRFVHDCLAEQGTWANTRVCPHFINTDRFMPNSTVRSRMRQQFGVQDRFVATVVAQLIPEKGIDVALRAMTELPEKVMLWIIGTGNQADELQTLSRTLRIDDRVRFLGLKRRVEPFLQASDCFVLPSRWKEAAGFVLLEAQASGVPVVASRIGGIPEYVDEDRTGFLFTPEDASDLAGHVRMLSNDAGLCRRMGQQARALAVEHFAPQAQIADWLDFYRQ